MKMEGFSVIMPTYNQATYIRRAIKSLFSQTYNSWELIIINDGATDDIDFFIDDLISNSKITYIKNKENQGLGYAINQGLDKAKYNLIAYLPSDDFYYENHLYELHKQFQQSEDTVLAFTKLNSEEYSQTNGLLDSLSLQLVQVGHINTNDRWVTRQEWISDDLYELFWNKLIKKGVFAKINKITSKWTEHEFQHHRLAKEERGGGINIYRRHYNVKTPLRFKVSENKFIDENELYKNYRKPVIKTNQGNPLKILLVGELAYNPERVFAFEEYGHKLYGLWVKKPKFTFNTVGPLPFGNITDLSDENWQAEIEKIKPDIIYATLNWGAISLAFEVLQNNSHIPFVWHFKEGPFYHDNDNSREKLIGLFAHADGKIYINPESKEWFEQFIPSSGLSFILDGDMPKKDYFTDHFSPKLSNTDNDVHIVIPGRIVGISPKDMIVLGKNKIHIHSYVENYLDQYKDLYKLMENTNPGYFHFHKHCKPNKWVEEFSQYDAGWLHSFDSSNMGKIVDAKWDDLNMPARMTTLAAAGLPMIQKDNSGHLVATQNLVNKNNIGICYRDINDLVIQLKDKKKIIELTKNMLEHRLFFSFDYHVPALIDFFRKVIKNKKR